MFLIIYNLITEIAESIEELADLLDKFHIYCSQWKLEVNHENTKVVIFGDKSKHPSLIKFNYQPREVVGCFVVLPKSRSFYQTKKHVVEQAQKALFGLYRKIRNLELPLDCQLKLFDNTIIAILTYGCGFGDMGILVLLNRFIQTL